MIALSVTKKYKREISTYQKQFLLLESNTSSFVSMHSSPFLSPQLTLALPSIFKESIFHIWHCALEQCLYINHKYNPSSFFVIVHNYTAAWREELLKLIALFSESA